MSYSSELKNNLKEMSMKKRCCRHSFFYGETLFLPEKKKTSTYDLSKYGYAEGSDFSSILFENFRCPSCKSSFLRGVFYSAGTVSDPAKSFHLEIKTDNEKLADSLREYISANCVGMKKTKRADRFSLYLKKGDDIEDLMHFMGAGKEAFEVANEKIKRDFLNLANRRSNFEVVNIAKTVNASTKTIEAIKELERRGMLSKLPSGLEETARLRLENPFANLEELAEMHSERITKSGVNHRLKKLIEISDID